VVVGRHSDLEGGRLDVLAIDPQGRWTISEIKRGALRRATIAQALDDASCIAALSADGVSALLIWYPLGEADGVSFCMGIL